LKRKLEKKKQQVSLQGLSIITLRLRVFPKGEGDPFLLLKLLKATYTLALKSSSSYSNCSDSDDDSGVAGAFLNIAPGK
jgi:hypothetical protein